MRARHFVNGIGNFFETFGSAVAVSAAVSERRPARPADLVRLGIDPERFREIKYR